MLAVLILKCVSSIKDWCSSRRLQLNAEKTEIIWFSSKTKLKMLDPADLSLSLGSTTVEPVVSVRNLGVYMDNEMNMRIHIGKICSAYYFHLRRLRQLQHIVSKATMQRLVSAFILSHLDYCNSVLAGLPAATLASMREL